VEIKTRDIRVSDYESIKELMEQVSSLHYINRADVFLETNEPFKETYLRKILEDENYFAFLVQFEDIIVGFCVVKIQGPSENPLLVPRTIACIESLCVREDYRRKGIGRFIFDEIQRRARNFEVDSIELKVWSFNQSAIKFYKEIGMKEKNIIMEMKL
jgi:ribosomal protein S18 acetylase RimI-like enzyme